MTPQKVNPLVVFSFLINIFFLLIVIVGLTTPWLTPLFYKEGFPGICFSLAANRPMEYEYISKISTLCGTDQKLSVIFVQRGKTETVYRPGKTYKVTVKDMEYLAGNPTVNLEVLQVETDTLLDIQENLTQGQIFSHGQEDFEVLYVSQERKDFIAIVARFDQR